MSGKRQALALLALGAAAGAGIWVLSPWLIGTAEPWDAEAPIWGASWLVAAVLGGLVGRLRGACLPLGYALGQFLVTIRSPFGPFGLIGWSFIADYALEATILALAIIGAVRLIGHLRARWRARR